MKQLRRPKPQKRRRLKVEPRVHRDKLRPSRVFRVRPDESRPFVEGAAFAMTVERECMGLVRSWWSPRTRRAGILRRGGVVARMFLNVKDLRAKPSTIVPHECTHAAMAWARFLGVGIGRAQKDMPSEEVVAYAVGDLVRQVNRVCYAHGVWA